MCAHLRTTGIVIYTRVVVVIHQTIERKRTIVRHPRKLVFVYKDAYRRARYVDI